MTTRMKFASTLLALAFAFGATGWSQDSQATGNASYQKSPERYFKLTFRVLNISPEGKVAGTRSYNEIIATGPKSDHTSSIRTGDRVPVATGSYSSGSGSLVNTQFQYVDIGTNIDAIRAEVLNQMLSLHVSADISGMATTVAMGNMHEPVIRQTKWESNVTVPIGKPTLIFSSDDSSDKGKTELELTATPIGE